MYGMKRVLYKCDIIIIIIIIKLLHKLQLMVKVICYIKYNGTYKVFFLL